MISMQFKVFHQKGITRAIMVDFFCMILLCYIRDLLGLKSSNNNEFIIIFEIVLI